jgi:hypothetical protein
MWTISHKSPKQQKKQARIFLRVFTRIGSANFHHILFASRVLALRLFSERRHSLRPAAPSVESLKHDETRRPQRGMARNGRTSLNESRRNQRPAINLVCRLRRGGPKNYEVVADNLDGSIPTKPKSQAHRLLSEIHSLNEADLKILDELRTVAPATASLLRWGYDAIAPTMRETNRAGGASAFATVAESN